MGATEIVLFVVDDDPAVRRAVARLLQAAHYTVETFASAQDFLAKKPDRKPGCLILDLQMDGLNGLELQEALINAGRQLPIIFISGHGDIPSSVRAMKAGAVDFLTKPFDQKTLLATVADAVQKSRDMLKERSEQSYIQHHANKLTARERQVMRQVVVGRLNKQIAFKLGISEKTVKVHRARVMEKMRVGSVAELVRLSEKANLPTTKVPSC